MKAIIFDFDGVILDSVSVKTEAFKQLYKSHGINVVEKVAKYHLANGGISRFEKFKYFHKNFLNINISNDELVGLGEDFSRLVFKKVCESRYIPGAHEFLTFCSKKYLTFICTGTPETEIKKILSSKNLDKMFNDIYGSPSSKTDIINRISVNNNLKSNEIIFIGDAMTDYDASKNTNVDFIGVRNLDTQFPEHVILVDNLTEIIKLKNL
tara:strand:- start:58 stop:687 length:630 start_codon:yes stop_codon:yes gene_type:complete